MGWNSSGRESEQSGDAELHRHIHFTSLASYRATLIGIQNGLTPAEIRASGGGASQFTLAAGNPLASINQADYGFFLQDDWRVASNLLLSGGLRYEGQNHVHDWTDLGPRLSLAWAPGARKGAASKNVIRVGFGMFYDRLSESLTLDAIRQNGVRQQQYLINNPD
ncbi:MAG TPA: TonB-dependent receptor, partial [Bryobacteraceae bacterium]|nr:TonB-dependent receptor [Bryobacteraceae bacterium]